MALTHDEVRHIAKLARLKLTESEVEKYSTQMTGILSWIDMLKEVDVENVEPTSQVTGMVSSGREDIVIPSTVTRDELLASSELPREAKQVRVKAVL